MGENCKKTPTEQHKMCMKSEFSVSMWNRVGEQKKLEVVQAKEECSASSIHLQLSIPGESWNKDYGTDERWLEAFSLPTSFEWPAVQVNTTFRNLMLLWYETTKKNPDTFICPCLSLLIHWSVSVSVPGLKQTEQIWTSTNSWSKV